MINYYYGYLITGHQHEFAIHGYPVIRLVYMSHINKLRNKY